jgi:hypothetical protein
MSPGEGRHPLALFYLSGKPPDLMAHSRWAQSTAPAQQENPGAPGESVGWKDWDVGLVFLLPPHLCLGRDPVREVWGTGLCLHAGTKD